MTPQYEPLTHEERAKKARKAIRKFRINEGRSPKRPHLVVLAELKREMAGMPNMPGALLLKS